MAKIILIFIDGLGIPDKELVPDSPLCNDLKVFNTRYIFNGNCNGFKYCGLDACMGVPGIPQSATGQSSIYTGLNTQKLLERHLIAYPNRILTEIIFNKSLFVRLNGLNKKAIFMNAYTEEYFWILKNDFGIDGKKYILDDVTAFIRSIKYRHRFSVTTIQNLSVNNPFYSIKDLEKDRSVFHDIDGHTLLRHNLINGLIPYERIINAFLYNLERYDLVLFEYFLTDIYGHKRNNEMVHRSLNTLDTLIYLLSCAIDSNSTSLLVVSDHGNMEDLSTSSHTLNKALFIYHGNKLSDRQLPADLSQVSDFIVSGLS